MLRMGPSRYQARVLRVFEAISHPRLSELTQFMIRAKRVLRSSGEPRGYAPSVEAGGIAAAFESPAQKHRTYA